MTERNDGNTASPFTIERSFSICNDKATLEASGLCAPDDDSFIIKSEIISDEELDLELLSGDDFENEVIDFPHDIKSEVGFDCNLMVNSNQPSVFLVGHGSSSERARAVVKEEAFISDHSEEDFMNPFMDYVDYDSDETISADEYSNKIEVLDGFTPIFDEALPKTLADPFAEHSYFIPLSKSTKAKSSKSSASLNTLNSNSVKRRKKENTKRRSSSSTSRLSKELVINQEKSELNPISSIEVPSTSNYEPTQSNQDNDVLSDSQPKISAQKSTKHSPIIIRIRKPGGVLVKTKAKNTETSSITNKFSSESTKDHEYLNSDHQNSSIIDAPSVSPELMENINSSKTVDSPIIPKKTLKRKRKLSKRERRKWNNISRWKERCKENKIPPKTSSICESDSLQNVPAESPEPQASAVLSENSLPSPVESSVSSRLLRSSSFKHPLVELSIISKRFNRKKTSKLSQETNQEFPTLDNSETADLFCHDSSILSLINSNNSAVVSKKRHLQISTKVCNICGLNLDLKPRLTLEDFKKFPLKRLACLFCCSSYRHIAKFKSHLGSHILSFSINCCNRSLYFNFDLYFKVLYSSKIAEKISSLSSSFCKRNEVLNNVNITSKEYPTDLSHNSLNSEGNGSQTCQNLSHKSVTICLDKDHLSKHQISEIIEVNSSTYSTNEIKSARPDQIERTQSKELVFDSNSDQLNTPLSVEMQGSSAEFNTQMISQGTNQKMPLTIRSLDEKFATAIDLKPRDFVKLNYDLSSATLNLENLEKNIEPMSIENYKRQLGALFKVSDHERKLLISNGCAKESKVVLFRLKDDFISRALNPYGYESRALDAETWFQRVLSLKKKLEKKAVAHAEKKNLESCTFENCRKCKTRFIKHLKIDLLSDFDFLYPCNNCYFNFDLRHKFNEHVYRIHPFQGPFRCHLCKYISKFWFQFVFHVKVHDMNRFLCEKCSVSVNLDLSLYSHDFLIQYASKHFNFKEIIKPQLVLSNFNNINKPKALPSKTSMQDVYRIIGVSVDDETFFTNDFYHEETNYVNLHDSDLDLSNPVSPLVDDHSELSEEPILPKASETGSVQKAEANQKIIETGKNIQSLENSIRSLKPDDTSNHSKPNIGLIKKIQVSRKRTYRRKKPLPVHKKFHNSTKPSSPQTFHPKESVSIPADSVTEFETTFNCSMTSELNDVNPTKNITDSTSSASKLEDYGSINKLSGTIAVSTSPVLSPMFNDYENDDRIDIDLTTSLNHCKQILDADVIVSSEISINNVDQLTDKFPKENSVSSSKTNSLDLCESFHTASVQLSPDKITAPTEFSSKCIDDEPSYNSSIGTFYQLRYPNFKSQNLLSNSDLNHVSRKAKSDPTDDQSLLPSTSEPNVELSSQPSHLKSSNSTFAKEESINNLWSSNLEHEPNSIPEEDGVLKNIHFETFTVKRLMPISQNTGGSDENQPESPKDGSSSVCKEDARIEEKNLANENSFTAKQNEVPLISLQGTEIRDPTIDDEAPRSSPINYKDAGSDITNFGSDISKSILPKPRLPLSSNDSESSCRFLDQRTNEPDSLDRRNESVNTSVFDIEPAAETSFSQASTDANSSNNNSLLFPTLCLSRSSSEEIKNSEDSIPSVKILDDSSSREKTEAVINQQPFSQLNNSNVCKEKVYLTAGVNKHSSKVIVDPNMEEKGIYSNSREVLSENDDPYSCSGLKVGREFSCSENCLEGSIPCIDSHLSYQQFHDDVESHGSRPYSSSINSNSTDQLTLNSDSIMPKLYSPNHKVCYPKIFQPKVIIPYTETSSHFVMCDDKNPSLSETLSQENLSEKEVLPFNHSNLSKVNLPHENQEKLIEEQFRNDEYYAHTQASSSDFMISEIALTSVQALTGRTLCSPSETSNMPKSDETFQNKVMNTLNDLKSENESLPIPNISSAEIDASSRTCLDLIKDKKVRDKFSILDTSQSVNIIDFSATAPVNYNLRLSAHPSRVYPSLKQPMKSKKSIKKNVSASCNADFNGSENLGDKCENYSLISHGETDRSENLETRKDSNSFIDYSDLPQRLTKKLHVALVKLELLKNDCKVQSAVESISLVPEQGHNLQENQEPEKVPLSSEESIVSINRENGVNHSNFSSEIVTSSSGNLEEKQDPSLEVSFSHENTSPKKARKKKYYVPLRLLVQRRKGQRPSRTKNRPNQVHDTVSTSEYPSTSFVGSIRDNLELSLPNSPSCFNGTNSNPSKSPKKFQAFKNRFKRQKGFGSPKAFPEKISRQQAELAFGKSATLLNPNNAERNTLRPKKNTCTAFEAETSSKSTPRMEEIKTEFSKPESTLITNNQEAQFNRRKKGRRFCIQCQDTHAPQFLSKTIPVLSKKNLSTKTLSKKTSSKKTLSRKTSSRKTSFKKKLTKKVRFIFQDSSTTGEVNPESPDISQTSLALDETSLVNIESPIISQTSLVTDETGRVNIESPPIFQTSFVLEEIGHVNIKSPTISKCSSALEKIIDKKVENAVEGLRERLHRPYPNQTVKPSIFKILGNNKYSNYRTAAGSVDSTTFNISSKSKHKEHIETPSVSILESSDEDKTKKNYPAAVNVVGIETVLSGTNQNIETMHYFENLNLKELPVVFADSKDDANKTMEDIQSTSNSDENSSIQPGEGYKSSERFGSKALPISKQSSGTKSLLIVANHDNNLEKKYLMKKFHTKKEMGNSKVQTEESIPQTEIVGNLKQFYQDSKPCTSEAVSTSESSSPQKLIETSSEESSEKTLSTVKCAKKQAPTPYFNVEQSKSPGLSEPKSFLQDKNNLNPLPGNLRNEDDKIVLEGGCISSLPKSCQDSRPSSAFESLSASGHQKDSKISSKYVDAIDKILCTLKCEKNHVPIIYSNKEQSKILELSELANVSEGESVQPFQKKKQNPGSCFNASLTVPSKADGGCELSFSEVLSVSESFIDANCSTSFLSSGSKKVQKGKKLKKVNRRFSYTKQSQARKLKYCAPKTFLEDNKVESSHPEDRRNEINRGISSRKNVASLQSNCQDLKHCTPESTLTSESSNHQEHILISSKFEISATSILSIVKHVKKLARRPYFDIEQTKISKLFAPKASHSDKNVFTLFRNSKNQSSESVSGESCTSSLQKKSQDSIPCTTLDSLSTLKLSTYQEDAMDKISSTLKCEKKHVPITSINEQSQISEPSTLECLSKDTNLISLPPENFKNLDEVHFSKEENVQPSHEKKQGPEGYFNASSILPCKVNVGNKAPVSEVLSVPEPSIITNCSTVFSSPDDRYKKIQKRKKRKKVKKSFSRPKQSQTRKLRNLNFKKILKDKNVIKCPLNNSENFVCENISRNGDFISQQNNYEDSELGTLEPMSTSKPSAYQEDFRMSAKFENGSKTMSSVKCVESLTPKSPFNNEESQDLKHSAFKCLPKDRGIIETPTNTSLVNQPKYNEIEVPITLGVESIIIPALKYHSSKSGVKITEVDNPCSAKNPPEIGTGRSCKRVGLTPNVFKVEHVSSSLELSSCSEPQNSLKRKKKRDNMISKTLRSRVSPSTVKSYTGLRTKNYGGIVRKCKAQLFSEKFSDPLLPETILVSSKNLKNKNGSETNLLPSDSSFTMDQNPFISVAAPASSLDPLPNFSKERKKRKRRKFNFTIKKKRNLPLPENRITQLRNIAVLTTEPSLKFTDDLNIPKENSKNSPTEIDEVSSCFESKKNMEFKTIDENSMKLESRRIKSNRKYVKTELKTVTKSKDENITKSEEGVCELDTSCFSEMEVDKNLSCTNFDNSESKDPINLNLISSEKNNQDPEGLQDLNQSTVMCINKAVDSIYPLPSCPKRRRRRRPKKYSFTTRRKKAIPIQENINSVKTMTSFSDLVPKLPDDPNIQVDKCQNSSPEVNKISVTPDSQVSKYFKTGNKQDLIQENYFCNQQEEKVCPSAGKSALPKNAMNRISETKKSDNLTFPKTKSKTVDCEDNELVECTEIKCESNSSLYLKKENEYLQNVDTDNNESKIPLDQKIILSEKNSEEFKVVQELSCSSTMPISETTKANHPVTSPVNRHKRRRQKKYYFTTKRKRTLSIQVKGCPVKNNAISSTSESASKFPDDLNIPRKKYSSQSPEIDNNSFNMGSKVNENSKTKDTQVLIQGSSFRNQERKKVNPTTGKSVSHGNSANLLSGKKKSKESKYLKILSKTSKDIDSIQCEDTKCEANSYDPLKKDNEYLQRVNTDDCESGILIDQDNILNEKNNQGSEVAQKLRSSSTMPINKTAKTCHPLPSRLKKCKRRRRKKLSFTVRKKKPIHIQENRCLAQTHATNSSFDLAASFPDNLNVQADRCQKQSHEVVESSSHSNSKIVQKCKLRYKEAPITESSNYDQEEGEIGLTIRRSLLSKNPVNHVSKKKKNDDSKYLRTKLITEDGVNEDLVKCMEVKCEPSTSHFSKVENEYFKNENINNSEAEILLGQELILSEEHNLVSENKQESNFSSEATNNETTKPNFLSLCPLKKHKNRRRKKFSLTVRKKRIVQRQEHKFLMETNANSSFVEHATEFTDGIGTLSNKRSSSFSKMNEISSDFDSNELEESKVVAKQELALKNSLKYQKREKLCPKSRKLDVSKNPKFLNSKNKKCNNSDHPKTEPKTAVKSDDSKSCNQSGLELNTREKSSQRIKNKHASISYITRCTKKSARPPETEFLSKHSLKTFSLDNPKTDNGFENTDFQMENMSNLGQSAIHFDTKVKPQNFNSENTISEVPGGININRLSYPTDIKKQRSEAQDGNPGLKFLRSKVELDEKVQSKPSLKTEITPFSYNAPKFSEHSETEFLVTEPENPSPTEPIKLSPKICCSSKSKRSNQKSSAVMAVFNSNSSGIDFNINSNVKELSKNNQISIVDDVEISLTVEDKVSVKSSSRRKRKRKGRKQRVVKKTIKSQKLYNHSHVDTDCSLTSLDPTSALNSEDEAKDSKNKSFYDSSSAPKSVNTSSHLKGQQARLCNELEKAVNEFKSIKFSCSEPIPTFCNSDNDISVKTSQKNNKFDNKKVCAAKKDIFQTPHIPSRLDDVANKAKGCLNIEENEISWKKLKESELLVKSHFSTKSDVDNPNKDTNLSMSIDKKPSEIEFSNILQELFPSEPVKPCLTNLPSSQINPDLNERKDVHSFLNLNDDLSENSSKNASDVSIKGIPQPEYYEQERMASFEKEIKNDSHLPKNSQIYEQFLSNEASPPESNIKENCENLQEMKKINSPLCEDRVNTDSLVPVVMKDSNLGNPRVNESCVMSAPAVSAAKIHLSKTNKVEESYSSSKVNSSTKNPCMVNKKHPTLRPILSSGSEEQPVYYDEFKAANQTNVQPINQGYLQFSEERYPTYDEAINTENNFNESVPFQETALPTMSVTSEPPLQHNAANSVHFNTNKETAAYQPINNSSFGSTSNEFYAFSNPPSAFYLNYGSVPMGQSLRVDQNGSFYQTTVNTYEEAPVLEPFSHQAIPQCSSNIVLSDGQKTNYSVLDLNQGIMIQAQNCFNPQSNYWSDSQGQTPVSNLFVASNVVSTENPHVSFIPTHGNFVASMTEVLPTSCSEEEITYQTL